METPQRQPTQHPFRCALKNRNVTLSEDCSKCEICYKPTEKVRAFKAAQNHPNIDMRPDKAEYDNYVKMCNRKHPNVTEAPKCKKCGERQIRAHYRSKTGLCKKCANKRNGEQAKLRARAAKGRKIIKPKHTDTS